MMRSAANEAAQEELKARSEIGVDAHRFEVLDRVTGTCEAARDLCVYREGRVVEVQTNLPSQRLTRGQIGVIVSSENGVVRLAMRDGSERLFEPGQLPRNLDRDAVSVHAVKRSTCTKEIASAGRRRTRHAICSMPGWRGSRRSGTG